MAKFGKGRPLFVALAMVAMHCASIWAAEPAHGKPSRIWSDLFDGWDKSPVCGTESSPLPPAYFQQGPTRESGGGGGPGALVVDPNGVMYVSAGTAVYRIKDGRVELLAGTPGVAGHQDGPADRALFNGISVLAFRPNGTLILLEQANRCVRSLEPGDKGCWRVRTLVGTPASKKEAVDGDSASASFVNPCGMTVIDDDSIYFMDNNWIRRFKDGKLITINSDGGDGFSDGPLKGARFRIAYTHNCITSDGKKFLYIADMWNNVLRKVDLEAQEISTVAGGPIRSDPKAGALRQGRDPYQDGQGMETLFHPGGGVTTVWCDRHTGNLYLTVADDIPHVLTPDGWLKSLRGDVPVASDPTGRMYVMGKSGIHLLRKLGPDEKPYQPELAPPGEEPIFKQAAFDEKSIPEDVKRFSIAKPVKPPDIDGILDDPCWQDSKPYRLTTGHGETSAPEIVTDLRVVADDTKLYLALTCSEPAMQLMNLPNRNRDDDRFYTDDYVEVFLIPGLDPHGDVFQVMINAAGETWDAKNKNARAWNPKLEIKTKRNAEAWTAEIAISFSELLEKAHPTQWRMNVGRGRPERGATGPLEVTWAVLYSSSSHTYRRYNVVTMEALDAKQP